MTTTTTGTPTTTQAALAAALRGTIPAAPANARAVAAMTANPGCVRRRVIDAAGVPAHELAARVGYPSDRGQSPFAITSGNMFENQLKARSRYRQLAESLSDHLTLPDPPRVVDLSRVGRTRDPQAWKDARVVRTNQVLADLADGATGAPDIVDHPMLVMDVAGSAVYLEPDALALRAGRMLQLVEIKSYPIIDGQADPAKVAATAGQSAVYLLAMRAALAALGRDPDMLAWSVILVAPRNFGRSATAHEIPLRKKAQSIQRVLDRATPLPTLIAGLPAGFTLDPALNATTPLDDQELADQTAARLGALQCTYVPECLSSCDMAGFCRDQAIAEDMPARLGRATRDLLGGVDHLADALTLANTDPATVEPALTDVAEALGAARTALDRARAAAPAACGLGSSPAGGAR